MEPAVDPDTRITRQDGNGEVAIQAGLPGDHDEKLAIDSRKPEFLRAMTDPIDRPQQPDSLINLHKTFTVLLRRLTLL